nr:SOS response-associated peptidase [Candidatus Delongbacteria bacterium]
MCGRFILVQKLEKLASRFEVNIPDNLEYTPAYNISPGKYSLVITDRYPNTIERFRFGLTPFWSKKNMLLFNARAEGDRNHDNDPTYHGAKDIISKPAFRKPIRSQRCLVIADAFYEGSTANGLDESYLIFLKHKQRPFAFAGIWDSWKHPDTGNEIDGFSIITTTPNELIQKIPHHRSPVILTPKQERLWLNPNTPLTDITACLKPYPAEKMDAYPVSKAVKNPRNDTKALINPAGDNLNPD